MSMADTMSRYRKEREEELVSHVIEIIESGFFLFEARGGGESEEE